METDLHSLFARAASTAADYRDKVSGLPVQPRVDRAELTGGFGGPLPAGPTPAAEVLDQLVRAAEPGLVATVGPRFFGFVIGGATPASTAADMLAAGWDQCAFNEVLSPAAGAAERAAGAWLKQLLHLPASASTGFVTGAQAANTVGLAVGRDAVLSASGWDVAVHGLAGAPPVRVVASEERHATIDRAAQLLGLGLAAIEPVAAGDNGAIDVDDLARVLSRDGGPTVVCLQLGNVNTGACDDLRSAIPLARDQGAWVHVDGAFGLWAGASPETAHLVAGVELADSWGADAHKWLNVPYDCGLSFCAHPARHAATMSYRAPYLTGSAAPLDNASDVVLGDLTPESSRRARGFAVWAALRELGATGAADLVERSCALARRMAQRLAEGGAEIHNEVVLNQVLVGFGDDGRTDAIIDRVQREGTCWVGGTTWRGSRLIRVSVSNATTTEDDIDLSADAILRAARAEAGG